MRRNSSLSWMMTLFALLALALGLLSLPADFSQPIRLAARDLARPGQAATRICLGWCHAGLRQFGDWQARRRELTRLKAELESAHAREREYQVLLTSLRQRVSQAEVRAETVMRALSSEPLFTAEIIEARILGHETVALAASRKLLDVGKSQGVGENLLVVESGRETLDIGTDLGLTMHQPVFSGKIVIGRTASCGRYSSSLQAVTDAKFQGPAQVLRKTAAGLQGGPEGVLEGTGKAVCHLTGIWSGDAVEVGDEVYTRAEDPLLPHPMFYGRIVRAVLNPGMPQWEIDVEPAAKGLRPTFVNVLRPAENGARVTAN